MPSEEDVLYQEKLHQLASRCEVAGLDYEEEEAGPIGRVGRVAMPCGRNTRTVAVTKAVVDDLLAVPFETLSFIGRYDAVFSKENGDIEALVSSASDMPMNLQRLAGIRWNEDPPNPLLEVRDEKGVELVLGSPSSLFRSPLVFGSGKLALRIRGLQITQHDQAEQALEKLANSLFFQIDSISGVPLMLRGPRRGRRPLRGPKRSDVPLAFPSSEFDPEPMSLYWYARGANRMPLLQFLAYYQVLEFYFAQYAAGEARRRVRNTLKDPLFDPHSDRDITRVLIASGYEKRRGFIDERAQLRATVRACANPSDLREYVFSQPHVKFFEKKADGLTGTTLRSAMTNDELLDASSDRIYDIRCKIVHTKESGDGEDVHLLLPFSPEAERLGRDIDLLHLIARSALVAGSRRLQAPAPAV